MMIIVKLFLMSALPLFVSGMVVLVAYGVPSRWKLLPEAFLEILYATTVCITYSFVVHNPSVLGNFLLFVGQDQLGENDPTYSQIWFRYKICITHSG